MPLGGVQPYEVSKSCADLVAQSYAATYGLPVAIARCGNIYGPGDLNWSRIVPGTIRSLLRGEQPIIRSDGTFVRDYLHVDDVVDAYLALADAAGDARPAGAAYNFSDESPPTVARALRRDLQGGRRARHRAARSSARRPTRSTTSTSTRRGPAPSSAGRPRSSLDDGLARTVEWYRDLLADA